MKITDFRPAWSKTDSLALATCQIILFSECFNAFCSQRAIGNPEQSFSTSSLLLAFHNDLCEREDWPEWLDLVPLLSQVNALPPFDRNLLDALTELLLEPAVVGHDRQRGWTLTGSSRLPRTPLPNLLTHEVWINPTGNGTHFASREISATRFEKRGRTRGWFWDQVVDPIAICHRVLMEAFPGRHTVERAEFFLQRSIKRHFGLRRFTNDIKYTFSLITTRFNEIFYNPSISLRFEDVQGIRSSIVDTPFLIEEIASIIQRAEQATTRADALRQSLGVFYFARFCRVLRVRYFRLPTLGSSTQSEIQSTHEDHIDQCLSAVRRLEFGYFLNRVFGSISEIPGLNFVFRGGILPRPETGRVLVVNGPPGSGKTVFALQKLCGVAARGGFAIYFSFEERLDLLVDRLVTFGLIEPERFEVITGGSDLIDKLTARDRSTGGVLALFTLGNSENYPLLDTIKELAELKQWQWRALVIDSINALQFAAGAAGVHAKSLPSLDRVVAREIIEVVEESGYLGIIIAEEDSERFDELEYVADTVIKLGKIPNDRNRWMEIRKCRSQNVHDGRHKIRFVEGEGISVIPSLAAIRSALRRRTKSTLSREKVISIPAKITIPAVTELAEKSSSLVYGYHGMGKTYLLLKLATEHAKVEAAGRHRIAEEPRAVLFVSFKTTEERFLRALRTDRHIYARWQRLRLAKVRWFSPGESLTGDEVVWEIWQQIQHARRRGLGIERIVFDELENSLIALPGVAKEPLFWTTLLQMISAEALTAFLGLSLEHDRGGESENELLYILRSEVDYVLHIKESPSSTKDQRPGDEQGLDTLSRNKNLEVVVEKCPEEMRDGASPLGTSLTEADDFDHSGKTDQTAPEIDHTPLE